MDRKFSSLYNPALAVEHWSINDLEAYAAQNIGAGTPLMAAVLARLKKDKLESTVNRMFRVVGLPANYVHKPQNSEDNGRV